MGKIIFISGGARSGKSRYAVKLIGRDKNVAFIATCQPLDKEMAKRIDLHKKARPRYWQTFEEPQNVSALLEKIKGKYEWILIDCLTLLVSNLLLKRIKEDAIKGKVNKILSILKKAKTKSIIISNEVGLGIVPKSKLARDFRDIAGRTNQIVAEGADEVFFMVSGIPWRLK